jgi:hypothetical protein
MEDTCHEGAWLQVTPASGIRGRSVHELWVRHPGSSLMGRGGGGLGLAIFLIPTHFPLNAREIRWKLLADSHPG